MSLSGTFDVFSLPEVLRMLASASKSGTLIVESSGRSARVELFEGECCGAEHGGADEPLVATHTPAALHARLLDVAFETGRDNDGAFRFAADEHARPRPAATAPVEPVLEELAQLQVEWDDIATVVPSTHAVPVLAARLPGDEIVVSAGEWALLACLDGVTAVRDLPGRIDGSLIDVCRALAGLVRRGAIDVAVAPITRPVRVAATEVLAEVMLDVAPPARVKRSRPSGETHDAELTVEVAKAADIVRDEEEPAGEDQGSDAAPVEGDRGAMLRMFSALRE